MSRIGLAFQLFFKILFNPAVAQQAQALALPKPAVPQADTETVLQKAEKPKPEPPAGVDALILLAALQREARFLDLFQEDLSEYEDAQIGAAVRDVHRDTQSTLARMFGISPIRQEEEGNQVNLSNQVDSGQMRLVGNVQGKQPESGTLVHRGWKATRCELPRFSGTVQQALVLAPAEVEVS